MLFNGRQRGGWRSPDVAVVAIAQHESGLSEWDSVRADVPDDLLDWRPPGESLQLKMKTEFQNVSCTRCQLGFQSTLRLP